ncbi:MAG: class I SAM-dependent methyltransferase [Candidatus Omnitrophota bacterium]
MGDTKSWKKHKGCLLDSEKGFDVIDCLTCGFKHIIPIPTFNELKSVYRHQYYTLEKPLYLERHREDLDWWNLVYSERYDIFEKELSLKHRMILDIGSGPGFFLLHGKQRGWETLGIEPSKKAAMHSKELGLNIREDFLTKKTAKQLGKFDVVHLSEVIEHISDPKGLLCLVRSILNPGGLICVVAPNDYNPFQYVLRKACGFKPWWVAPPHHINYFDFDSLSKLLKNSGFKIISCEATFPIDIFLLMGDNYVNNEVLGRQCHTKRKQFELNLCKAGMKSIYKKLYQRLAEMKIGREIVVYGRKV